MPSKVTILMTAALVTSGIFFSVPSTATVKKGAAKPPAAEAPVVESSPRGQTLALSCAGCHGTDGQSVGIIPSFYGKTPQYLEAALKDFKSGARVSTVMNRHAKGYTDEEIGLIAEYFGTVWTQK